MSAGQRVRSGGAFERLAGYARASRTGNLIFVSGTAALDGSGRGVPAGDAYGQGQEAIARALEAVARLGGAPEHVVRTRLYLDPAADWREAVRAHGEAFRGIDPANTTLFVHGFIPEDCLLEIELDAVID